MANIDKRVVEMKFDNAAFERGVSTTMSTLDKLKQKLNFDGAAKGLNGLSAAGKNVDLSNVAKGVDGIASKFTAMGVVGVTALATITNKAVNAGIQLVKAFTIAPILDGFHQYEQQLNATQTILSNTKASGENLASVTKVLDTLNEYANLTVYNFSDMATAMGSFTSAGLGLKTSSVAIQGLANVAAAAGSNAQQMANVLPQISQALSRGKVQAQDWMSVVSAGMASTNFKNAILETAKAMGTLKMPKTQSIEEWTKKGGSFQEAMQHGQITSAVLTNTLKALSGTLTDAELAQMGYTKQQIVSIKEQAKLGLAAAQNVKTFSQLKDNVSQGVGSAYAQVFKTIFGDLTAATTLFTGLSKIANAIFVNPILSLNEFLKKLKGLGVITNIGTGIKNIWTGITEVFHNVAHAFRDVFPPSSGQAILAISKTFVAFTEHLKMGAGTAGDLMKTFRGLFSILKIVVDVFAGVAKGVFSVFGAIGTGGGGALTTILKFTAVAGEFVTNIQKFLDKTGAIDTFFAVFTSPLKLLKPTVDIIIQLAAALSSLLMGDVSGFKAGLGSVGGLITGMFTGILDNYRKFASTLSGGFASIANFLTGFATRAKNSGNQVGAALANIGASIATFFSELANNASAAFSHLIDKITGVADQGKTFLSGFGSDATKKLTGAVDNLGNSMQGLKGKMDFKPTLAAFNTGFGQAADKTSSGMSALSSVSKAIGSVFTGIAHAFSNMGAQLSPILTSLRNFFTTLMDKITEYIGGMKGDDAIAVFNTGVLVGLYVLFKKFVSSFGGFMDDFRQIFTSISGVFNQLTDTLKMMQKSVKYDILLKIAIAMGILVAALYILSNIDQKKLIASLIALGVLFGELSATMAIINKAVENTSPGKMAAAGAELLLMAGAIMLLATAVKIMSTMKPEEMAKGLIGVGVLLTGITLFTKFSEADSGGVRAGVGLMLMATAINILSIALRVIGAMKLSDIVKAGVTIDLLMVSLASAANKMEGTLKGSAAMLIMATALGVLTPVLVTLGLLPYENLAKGLGTVAISLVLLAAAAQKFDTALPGAVAMLAVAGALAIITPSLVAFGLMPWQNIAKAMVTLGAALLILVVATTAMDTALPGAAALLIVAGALAILTPVIVTLGMLSWSAILKGVGGLALVLGVLIAAVYALTPVIAIMILATKSIALLGAAVLLAGLGFLAFSAALTAMAVTGSAGFAVLVAGVVSFLAVLPLIAKQVGYAFVTFIGVIGASAGKIIDAFTKIVMGMLKSLQTTVPEFIRTMGIILKAMLDEIVKRAPQIFAAGLALIVGFLAAIKSRIGQITNLVIDIFMIFLGTIKARLPNIIQAGIELILAFVNGLAQGIRDHKTEMGAAGRNIASALIEGAVAGVKALGPLAMEGIRALGRSIIDAFKGIFGIHSPSTVFSGFGTNLVQGLINGIGNAMGSATAAIGNLGRNILAGARSIVGDFVGIGGDIVGGLARGISNSAHRVMEAAQSLAGKLPGWAKKVLGIASPSKEFIKIGEFVNDGLVEGLSNGSRDKVQSTMEETAKLLTDAISGANDDIEKSTAKLNDLTEAQKKNTASRQFAQTELNNDIATLRKETSERGTHTAAIQAATAEIEKDKQKIQELTSARHVDIAAVKAARAELAQDEARLNSLRTARQADLDTIKAKGVEIEKDKERLRQLTVAEGDNRAAILATKEAIAEATAERDRATAASNLLANGFAAEKEQLGVLADQYEATSKQLDEANNTLEAAIKVRDDYKKSVSDKYADLPDVNNDTTLTDYIATLQKKVDDTNAFSAAVQKLRDMGLNDASYKELIEKGVDALPFVNALLEGGQSAVDQVNLIGANLITASNKLAADASAALYDAGVQAAQGVVNGLNSKLTEIQAAAAAIAAVVAQAVADELKIKSPSRVMTALGGYTVAGLVKGLNDSAPLAANAAETVANGAVTAMQDAMSRLSDGIDTNLDLVPTITPVLDLSDIRKGAGRLDAMMNVSPLTVGNSYSRAAEASKMYRANRDAELVSVGASADERPASVTFVQNNTSPKALSSADIYRRTNNQLSMAKEALTRNAN